VAACSRIFWARSRYRWARGKFDIERILKMGNLRSARILPARAIR